MDQAAGELREFRAELGNPCKGASVPCRPAAKTWWMPGAANFCDLCLFRAAAAGAGYPLGKRTQEYPQFPFAHPGPAPAENRSTITIRVNPEDESTVWWTCSRLPANSSSTSVSGLSRRMNISSPAALWRKAARVGGLPAAEFQEMVDNIPWPISLCPSLESEEESARAMRDIVDEEAAPQLPALPKPRLLTPCRTARLAKARERPGSFPGRKKLPLLKRRKREIQKLPPRKRLLSLKTAPGPESQILQNEPLAAGVAATDEAALDDEPAELTDASAGRGSSAGLCARGCAATMKKILPTRSQL